MSLTVKSKEPIKVEVEIADGKEISQEKKEVAKGKTAEKEEEEEEDETDPEEFDVTLSPPEPIFDKKDDEKCEKEINRMFDQVKKNYD